jgi:hypothetical protein
MLHRGLGSGLFHQGVRRALAAFVGCAALALAAGPAFAGHADRRSDGRNRGEHRQRCDSKPRCEPRPPRCEKPRKRCHAPPRCERPVVIFVKTDRSARRSGGLRATP